MRQQVRIFVAELIGTMVLVVGGAGTAVLATGTFFEGSVGALGVALAFGLSLLVMAYAIGNISGCHVNPVVTVGLWMLRKVDGALVPSYVLGQLAGGMLGGLGIFAVASGGPDGYSPTPSNFAVNGWDELSPGGFGFSAMVVCEIGLTALLVFVVASTTHKKFSAAAGGLAVGLTLTLIHLISIPIDNTSVNPARSLGVAVFAGGQAMSQLWAFIVFPLIGATVGVLAWKAVDDGATEHDVLGPTNLSDLVDLVDSGADVQPTKQTASSSGTETAEGIDHS